MHSNDRSYDNAAEAPPLHRLRAIGGTDSIELQAILKLNGQLEVLKCLRIAEAMQAQIRWPNIQMTAREELASRYDLTDEYGVQSINEDQEPARFRICGLKDSIVIESYENKDDGNNADIEHIVSFIRICANKLKLQGLWGFEWAFKNYYRKPKQFGGGMVVINLETGEAKYNGTRELLYEQLKDKSGKI